MKVFAFPLFWYFDIFIFWHFDILTFWHFDTYFDILILIYCFWWLSAAIFLYCSSLISRFCFGWSCFLRWSVITDILLTMLLLIILLLKCADHMYLPYKSLLMLMILTMMTFRVLHGVPQDHFWCWWCPLGCHKGSPRPLLMLMLTFGVPVASQLSVTARPSVARVSLLELSSMMFGGTEIIKFIITFSFTDYS